MTQYKSLNAKLSNSQLNELKSSMKNKTDAVLRLPSNRIGNHNDEVKFSHELLLTNIQVTNLRKAFGNKSSTDIKLSKTQLSKTIMILDQLLKTGSPSIKIVIKPLTKSVLILLGIDAAANAGVYEKY